MEHLLEGAPNATQHQNKMHTPKTVLHTVMGCSWLMHNVTWYLYPYFDIENAELKKWNVYLKPNRK